MSVAVRVWIQFQADYETIQSLELSPARFPGLALASLLPEKLVRLIRDAFCTLSEVSVTGLLTGKGISTELAGLLTASWLPSLVIDSGRSRRPEPL